MIDQLRHGIQTPGADIRRIEASESHFGIALPSDYKAFLLESDGFNDEVGQGYLVLWSVSELALAEAYEVFEIHKDRFLIGSNGGPTAYAVIEGKYCSIPFVFSGDWRDEVRELGSSFEEFVTAVATGEGW